MIQYENMKNTISLQLKHTDEKKLYDAWKDFEKPTPAYAKWQLRPENCVITCYESGKTLFQGKDAELYAAPFQIDHSAKHSANAPQPSSYVKKDILPQAGSDEVGTGDYFGPVVVCACIVDENHIDFLKQTGARDSKMLSDTDIRKIAPKLMEELPYSLLIVNNQKYNEVHTDNNMVKLKSRLHNQAYVNLSKKAQLPEFKVIDQFVQEKSYYRYLKNEPIVIRGIHFETKAEDKYPSVGAASVIARYAFLVAMDHMEKQYGMKFQKGAGSAVDACALRFVKQYGFEQLPSVAKMHFKNTDKVLIKARSQ